MTTDVESQLRELGRHWRARVPRVDSDEILDRPTPGTGDGGDPGGRIVGSSQSVNSGRHRRWPVAIAAVLVLMLVGALVVMVPRSDDADRVADDSLPLALRNEITPRWSIEVPAAGDELVPLGPVVLGDDVVVVAVQNQMTALDLVDGSIRWQREYDDLGPLGAIVDLRSFGETVVFSLGARIDDDESDPAVVGVSMADGAEQWRVSGGQAYSVIDGAVYEFEGLGGDDMSFRLVDPTDGSYLTEQLVVDRRNDVAAVGSLMIIAGDDGEPSLYDTVRRAPLPFPSAVDDGATTFALAGDDLIAVHGQDVVLHDDRGEEVDRLRLPEVAHDAPWVTAFPHRGMVVVSTGDGSVGVGVDEGRLAVRWEADAAVNSSAFDPTIAIDASSPLTITAGEGFTQPGGVIDLDSGEVLPFEGELRWALVARDGYAVLTAGLAAGDILRAHERDGEPTWTLDVPAVSEGLEQWTMGDDVLVLVSVTRSGAGTTLEVATYD